MSGIDQLTASPRHSRYSVSGRSPSPTATLRSRRASPAVRRPWPWRAG